MQYLEQLTHRIVQATVDRRKNDHLLLDAGHDRPDRHVGVVVGFIERGLDDLLAALDQELHQLQQHLARRVDRRRHEGFANIILHDPAVDFIRLARLYSDRLASNWS